MKKITYHAACLSFLFTVCFREPLTSNITMKSIFKIFVSCLLCLALPLLSGCGGASFTSADKAEADRYIAEHGKDALIHYMADAIDTDEIPPKLKAGKEFNLKYIEYLVSQGADVNAKSEDDLSVGITPLHFAATLNPNVDVIKFLVEKGADVNAKDNSDVTPLHAAALNPQVDILKYLIEKGADVNAKGKHGMTPLHFAAVNNPNVEVLKFLVEKGAEADDEHGETLLHHAANNPNVEILKYLVEKGADVNATNNHGGTVLDNAARNPNVEVFKYLIEKGAKVDVFAQNKYGWTLLHKAANNPNVEIFKYLIERGADVNAKTNSGGTPLLHAATSNNVEVFKFLIEKGADVNAKDDRDGETVLHSAAFNSDVEVLKFFIEKGVDVNVKSNSGRTPLHVAAAYNTNPEVLKFLIEKGADVDAKDNSDQIPLDVVDSPLGEANTEEKRRILREAENKNSMAGLTEPAMSSMSEGTIDSNRLAASAIQNFQEQLERYYTQHRRYPTTEEGLYALVYLPDNYSDAPTIMPTPGFISDFSDPMPGGSQPIGLGMMERTEWTQPFHNPNLYTQRRIRPNGMEEKRLLDPWNRPYRYDDARNAYGVNPLTGDRPAIWSAGPDGIDYTDDDIRNWNPDEAQQKLQDAMRRQTQQMPFGGQMQFGTGPGFGVEPMILNSQPNTLMPVQPDGMQ